MTRPTYPKQTGYKPRFYSKFDSRVYDAAFEVINRHPWNDPVAFSPTFKQAIKTDSFNLTPTLRSDEGVLIVGDHMTFDRNVHFFHNRLNKLLYGNGVKKKHHVTSFCVFETSANGRHHPHFILDKPQGISFAQFEYACRVSWLETPFGHNRMSFEKADGDWSRYMMKPSQKNGCYSDAFRWDDKLEDGNQPVTLPIHLRLVAKRNRWGEDHRLEEFWQAAAIEGLTQVVQQRMKKMLIDVCPSHC